jgi:hypothetical protein
MEYGMEFEVLFGVSDEIQDITRRSGMVHGGAGRKTVLLRRSVLVRVKHRRNTPICWASAGTTAVAWELVIAGGRARRALNRH